MQACVKASITLNESWDLSCQTDVVTQWYQVDGYVVFYPDHQDFHPVESAAIYDKDTPPLNNPLSETLVPYIGNNSLDKVAYRILSSFFYQEALEKPARVKPNSSREGSG